jgi:hypothetical protein
VIPQPNGWTAGVRFLEGARDFYRLHGVQTVSAAIPVFYVMRIGILDLGTRWCMVSYTARTPYCRGKSPRYPLDRRLIGPQSRYGRCGVEKNLLPLTEIKHRTSSPWTVSIRTELSRLFTKNETPFSSTGNLRQMFLV